MDMAMIPAPAAMVTEAVVVGATPTPEGGEFGEILNAAITGGVPPEASTTISQPTGEPAAQPTAFTGEEGGVLMAAMLAQFVCPQQPPAGSEGAPITAGEAPEAAPVQPVQINGAAPEWGQTPLVLESASSRQSAPVVAWATDGGPVSGPVAPAVDLPHENESPVPPGIVGQVRPDSQPQPASYQQPVLLSQPAAEPPRSTTSASADSLPDGSQTAAQPTRAEAPPVENDTPSAGEPRVSREPAAPEATTRDTRSGGGGGEVGSRGASDAPTRQDPGTPVEHSDPVFGQLPDAAREVGTDEFPEHSEAGTADASLDVDAAGPAPESPDASGAVAVRSAEPAVSADRAQRLGTAERVQADTPLHQRVIDQVVRDIRLHRIGDHSDIVVRLTPPELGTLRVHISQDAQGMTSQIQASTEQVRGLLQAHLPMLVDALSGAGVSMGAVSVTADGSFSSLMQGQAHGGDYGQPGDHRQGARGFGGSSGTQVTGAALSADAVAGAAGHSWLA